MTADETRDRLNRAFTAAIELPPAARSACIRQTSGGDRAFESRLHQLLELDDRVGILDAPLATLLPCGDHDERIDTIVGRRIGAYQIVRILGAGGMGTVYEAIQESPRRPVAIKMLHGGMVSRASLRRFEQEAEILGRLQHPAIARIYEAGVFESDTGPRPFFALELIHGRPLSQVLAECNLSIRERVNLLVRICLGVEHAHARGIIHRDLKPANILVSFNSVPESSVPQTAHGGPLPAGSSDQIPDARPDYAVKILDFGIARAIDSDTLSTTLRTDEGLLMGTLAYMSPEQLTGDPSRVTIQSDIYSLGLIGYELLSGRLPRDLRGLSLPDAIRSARENDPTPLRSINRLLRGDLDTIIAKALDAIAERRYRTVTDFRADLQRYLTDQPILARRPTYAYQLRKFAWRYKTLVGGVAAVFIVLLLGITGTAWQWSRAAGQRDRAIGAEREAEYRTSQVIDAANDILRAVEDSLADLPGGTPARAAIAREIVNQLSALPQNFEAHQPPPHSIPYLLAYAQHRVGEVALATGKTGEALSRFRSALAMREELVRRHPKDDIFVRTLGVGHSKVAEALMRQGQFGEAGEHLEQALRIQERVIERNDGDTPENAGVYLGGGYRRMGELAVAVGDAPAAISHFRRSLELVNASLSQQPGILNLRRGKASSLRGLGEALLAQGRCGEAVAAIRESLEVTEELCRDSKNPRLWDLLNLARTNLSMSRALAAMDACSHSLPHAQRACAIAERLSGDDPANFDSGLLLARCRAHLGEVRWQCEAAANAALELDSAIAIFERLVRASPDSPEVRHGLVLALICRSRCHASHPSPSISVCARAFLDRALGEVELLRSSCFPPAVLATLEDRLKLAMQSERLARTP